MICRSCGTANLTQAAPRGSGWIEIVLWLTFIIPIALVYSIWRRVGARPACSACGSQDLVGLATPVGRALAAQHHPEGVPAPPAALPRPSVLHVVGRAVVLIAAGLVGTFVVLFAVG